MFRLVFLLMFLFTGLCNAQNEQLALLEKQLTTQKVDSIFIAEVNKQTSNLRSTGEFETALLLNSRLLEEINLATDFHLGKSVIYERTEIQYRSGSYNDALKTAHKGVKLSNTNLDSLMLAQLYNQIGSIYYRKNNLDSTLAYYNKAYFLKEKLKADPWQLAIAAYNKALVQIKILDYDEALSSYLEAIEWYKKSDSEVIFLPRVYSSIAILYKEKSNFIKAEEYASLALKKAQEQYKDTDRNLMIIYNHQASIARAQGKYEKAQPFIKKSILLSEAIYGTNHYWPATVYGGLAKNYLDLKKEDSASIAIQKAISIGKNLEDGFDFGNLYHIESEILREQHKYNESLLSIEKSRNFYKTVYGNSHWLIASTWLQQAKTLYKSKEKQLALNALDSVFYHTKYTSEDLSRLQNPFITLEALHYKFLLGTVHEKQQSIASHIALVQHVKTHYQTAEDKLFFATTAATLINVDADFCYQQYKETNDNIYAEMAFKLIQLHSNSILAEEIQHSESTSLSEINTFQNDVRTSRKNWLTIKEALHNAQQQEQPDKNRVDSLLLKRIEASQHLENAIKIYEENNLDSPRVLKLSSIPALRKSMGSDTQLLQYFVSDSIVYGFYLSNKERFYIELWDKPTLQNFVIDYKEAIKNRKPIKDIESILFEKLIAPIPIEDTKQLIVLTDDVLSYIPIGSLRDKNGAMLLDKTAVSFLPAISMLQKKNVNKKLPNYWSGFAVNYTGKQAIPNSVSEVETIEKITSGTALFDSEVTKEMIFSKGNSSQILHLGLHGIIDDTYPLYSKLVLQEKELTASEIYSERIASQLVVLSACDTGTGTLQKGEGVLSLSRAFTFSGASATLTSLWEVPDEQTLKLMTFFYKNLDKGLKKNEALRLAKIEYLKNTPQETLRHPYYWAGFVLSGDVAPLSQKSTPILLYILGGMLILLFVGFVLKRAKKVSS